MPHITFPLNRSPQTTSDEFKKPPEQPKHRLKKTRKMNLMSTKMVKMPLIERNESEKRKWLS